MFSTRHFINHTKQVIVLKELGTIHEYSEINSLVRGLQVDPGLPFTKPLLDSQPTEPISQYDCLSGVELVH